MGENLQVWEELCWIVGHHMQIISLSQLGSIFKNLKLGAACEKISY